MNPFTLVKKTTPQVTETTALHHICIVTQLNAKVPSCSTFTLYNWQKKL